jgi:uncharacterized membrane protein YGL010W|tara:strand:+ start:227 stop:667 length:441 start_codon:yes stop_codon:yes gene_type:complete
MQFRIKSIEQWFTEYGESHRNATNKAIHWICVPLITYTLLGLLWALSPYALLVFSIVALVFYLTLSMLMSLVMLLAVIFMAWSFTLFSREALVISCVVIFVLAWIGQFIGHKIEGKKPSFFKDIQFLLVGPIWLLGFLFKRYGWAY